jgi:cysteine desulfurase
MKDNLKNAALLYNHQITTPLSSKVLEEMLPFFKEKTEGEIAEAVEKSLEEIYRLFGALQEDAFILTSSAAEAISQVISGSYFEVTRKTGKNHFLTTTIEEASILRAIQQLEEMQCCGKMIAVNSHGQLSPAALEEAITPRSALVSLAWANPLTGVIQPIAELIEVCRKKGVLIHIDASDAIGKLFFRFDALACDFLTFDGDRFHGPKGSGGLLIKRGISIPPLIFGGSEQKYLRGGTLNLPTLVGVKTALQEAFDSLDHMGTEIARLRDQLETGIIRGFPDAQVFYGDIDRLPHISAIAFPGIASDALLYALQRQQLMASAGGGRYQPLSRLLTAAGVEPVIAGSAISFSLSRETTEEEINRAISLIVENAKKLRMIS